MIRTFRESLGLLATRRFGTFWFASLLSSIGTWAQQVAEPWLLLTLGASPFLIGLDSFAMNAPIWFLTLLGGVLADRADRRRVITLFQSIQMLCPVVIVAMLVSGSVAPWIIIALSLVVGITDALSMPSYQSIVPSIVERRDLDRALALNSTQFNLSRILGPSIAGLLMTSFGAIACFVLSAASYVPFIGVALWILPRGSSAAARTDSTERRSPLAGIGEILGERHLQGALLTVFAGSVLCAPLVTFVPVVVRDVFHGDASGFSVAVAAFGVGGLGGAALLLGIPSSVDRRRLSSGFALVWAAVLIFVAFDPWFAALPVLLVVAGASMTICNTAANSLLQATTDRRLLGRTVSLYMLALRGGISLGALLTGATVGLLGVQSALLVDGALALAIQLVVMRLWLGAPLPTAERS